MAQQSDDLASAKRLMGALVRMPLKPHEEMKLGKPKGKPSKSLAKGKRKSPASEPKSSIHYNKFCCPLSFEPNEYRGCSRHD